MGKTKSTLASHFHYKQFHFIGVTSPDFVLGCAVVNIKYISSAFVYLYDIPAQKMNESSFILPLGMNCAIPSTPDEGCSSFSLLKNQFSITSTPLGRQLTVHVPSKMKINLSLTSADSFTPLRICTPTGYTGWTYTQKAAGLKVSGQIDSDGTHYDLNNINAYGNTDFSCGYMRRITNWNWSSFSGEIDGMPLGLNLAAGVNETGQTENCFWINNQMTKVDTVQFYFDPLDTNAPWHVTSADGKIDLTFVPNGVRKEKLNLGILASNFKQFFGKYSGTLKKDNGDVLTITNITGFAEDHYAKW